MTRYAVFDKYYAPELLGEDRAIREFALYTLTDAAEQDDHCAHIYHKSLLYLVSNAFEKEMRIPIVRDGWPILGMEKFITEAGDNSPLGEILSQSYAEWIKAPNDNSYNGKLHSTSSSHGGFDDDKPTLKGLLDRILGSRSDDIFEFHRSASSLRDRRQSMELV